MKIYVCMYICMHVCVCACVCKSKVGDHSRGRPEGSIFNSYYTKVLERALPLSLDCSTLLLIRTFYYWVLSKEVSSTILKVLGMTWPGIEPRSPGSLANTLLTCLWAWIRLANDIGISDRCSSEWIPDRGSNSKWRFVLISFLRLDYYFWG